MSSACCKAYGALGVDRFKEMAVTNINYLLRSFRVEGSDAFYHVVTVGIAKFPAFLDDYAFLAAALIDLQEITGESNYLLVAKKLTEYAEAGFTEADTG